MKQRLLSVAAALALTVGAFAQSWTPPVDPAQATDVQEGGTYFIKNVGCGQYILGANSWATQISVSTDGKPYFNVIAEAATVEETDPETQETFTTTGFKLKMNGTFYFSGDHNRKDYEISNKYLFRDSETSGFVDLGSQSRNAIWVLTKDVKGFYRIQSTLENGTFPNARTQFAYAKTPGQGVQFNMTEEELDPEDIKYIEWEFIPSEVSIDDIALYGARMSLYEELNNAVEAGIDYSAASTVYENENATVDEISAAATTLQGALRAKKIADLIASYNGEPVDITEYALTNPSFDGNTNGWEVTQDMGQNLGYQAGAAHAETEEEPAWNGYENGDIRISGFIEAWKPSAPLGDGVIAQTVYGLPEGRYLLTAQGIATDQVNNEQVEGVYLFYDNGLFVYHTEESLNTGNGLPEELIFEFDFDGSESAKIGMMTDNTNANWMCADNFKLYYIGESQTPAIFIALSNLVSSLNGTLSSIEAANNDAKTAFEQAYATAEGLVSDSPTKELTAEYQAAYESISQTLTALRASASAYKNFAALIEKMTEDDEKFLDKAGYEDYVQTIESLLNVYEPAYENGTYTTEQIEQAIADFQPLLKATVKKAFDEAVAAGQVLAEPLDITVLFDEMEIPYTTSQAAYAGEIWKEANNDGNFKTNYGTAEVWNSHSFNVYRELQLPAGKYTVTAKGFYRESANDSNYPSYINQEISGFTYLYAGNGQKQLTNVAEIAVEEAPENWTSPAGIETEESGTLYVPNNQYTAHEVFTDKDFAEKCLTSVSTVLSADGALRFGIKGDGLQDNQWSVWADFHIYFNVAQASDLDPDIESLIAQVEPMLDEIEIEGLNGPGGVAMGKTKLSDALAQGKAALNSDNADVKNAAITALNEALAYAEKSIELGVKITNTFSDYQEKENQLDPSFVSNYEGFATLMNDIETAMYDEAFESNEQIEGWLEALPSEWLNYILGWTALDAATIDNPVDLTTIIENADFSATDHTQGWTIETEATSGNRGTYENEFLEFWNVNAGWKIYQDLPKLREGFYTLQVDGCYRAAGTTAATDSLKNDNVKQNVIFFAGTMSTPLMAWTDAKGAIFSKLADAQNEYPDLTGNQFNYVVENDTTFFTAPNNRAQMLSFTNIGRYANSLNFGYTSGSFRFGLLQNVVYDNDWTPFGHFRLYYLGTEAPDAVKSIDAADASILAGREIYNLAGQKVGKAQKGIYIIGGRKVVVK